MSFVSAPLRPRREEAESPTVAIVGGGFSGAVLAHQLARRAPGAFRIVVIEPRERLGAGLAYSTADPAHRINVPASRMSFIQSDPCHFDRWLKADGALKDDPEALTPDGRAFPRRAVFGRYAAETIEPFLLSCEIEHRVARAARIERDGDDGYALSLSDGGRLKADIVALAATHPAPAVLPAFAGLLADPRLIRDTQTSGALDGVSPDARVLIVGAGLTMADIVASLDARGHRGEIVAVSRRGLLSRGHSDIAGEYGAFAEPPSRTALDLLRRIRRTVEAAESEGKPWHNVLDAVRAQGHPIWQGLPVHERRKIVRKLRAFWDVHRFRVAPQLEATIALRSADGTFKIIKGEPVAAEATERGLAVTIRPRAATEIVQSFDAVALATGPAHRSLVETDPLISRLASDGLVKLDEFGLGLATDERSRAIGLDGRRTPNFWISGPLARGAFGELMGLPEVARHGETVAGVIIKSRTAARHQVRAVA